MPTFEGRRYSLVWRIVRCENPEYMANTENNTTSGHRLLVRQWLDQAYLSTRWLERHISTKRQSCAGASHMPIHHASDAGCTRPAALAREACLR